MGIDRQPHDSACRCPHCMLVSARREHPRSLPIFTVYDRPKDAPDHVIVRLWLNDRPTTRSWSFDTLDAARVALTPLGLHCVARQAGDEPHIVETWL